MSRLKSITLPGSKIAQRCERSAVVVYRIRKDRVEFLLVSRNSDPDQFVLPGGHIDRGESLRKAAARECFEESGVKIRLRGPLVRYDHVTARGFIKPTMTYLATATTLVPSPEGREVIWIRHKDLSSGEYDVPEGVLDVLEFAAQCLRRKARAA